MKVNRSVQALMAAASLTLLTLGASGAAHADNMYWSIGMSSPGVQMGVANMPPMMVQQPVYMPTQPMYVAPRPVLYVQPAPVYYVRTGWSHQDNGRHVGYGRMGEAYGHGNDRYERGHERYERGREGNGHDNRR